MVLRHPLQDLQGPWPVLPPSTSALGHDSEKSDGGTWGNSSKLLVVMSSQLSVSPPTSNSIFPVGLLRGMKSLFPTTQTVGGKSLAA